MREIAAVTNRTFIVSERDQLFPGDPKSPSKLKRIYKTDLSNATDLSDPAQRAERQTREWQGARAFERSAAQERENRSCHQGAGGGPALPGSYPHDKLKGLAEIGDTLIAVSNDDYFGIVPDGRGGIAPKRLTGASNMVDVNRIYFIKLDKPLK